MASTELIPFLLLIAERTYCSSFEDWYSRVLILQDLLPDFPALGLQVRNKTPKAEDEFQKLLPYLHPSSQIWLNGPFETICPLPEIERFQRHFPENRIKDAPFTQKFATSIHSLKALEQALSLCTQKSFCPQFLQYGAVFPTSKPVKPLGIANLKQICLASPLPIFAVGGINSMEKIIECKRAGADGISIGSWIMQAKDMKQRIEEIL